MFENLSRTQNEVASQLVSLIENDNFPYAVLFEGDNFTGRMYASDLVCQALGIDDSNTVIVSDRNHFYRISTALKLFRRSRNKVSKVFLKSCARIMLQQYHGALMGTANASNRKKFEEASEASLLLDGLDDIRESEFEKFCSSLEKSLMGLADQNRTSSVSIAQVRAIRDWCATSNMDGQRKMVIIEGLENASEGAVNALLKTIEEPPENTYFILISSNPGRIPATILSRVRKMRFKELSEDGKNFILSSLFENPKAYDSLQSYFLSGSGINDSILKESAAALVGGESVDMNALVSELEKNQGWSRFYEHVRQNLQQKVLSDGSKTRAAVYLIDEIDNAISKGQLYNQNKRLTFDFVFFRTKELMS